MSAGAFRNFKPPGPVAAAFLSDLTSQVRLLRGPIGGGKTVTCTFDGLNRSSRIVPVCKDGIVHFRLAVCGTTYGQIERNLYPTWTYWLPKDGGEWTEGDWEGGGGRFARHMLKWRVPRMGRLTEVHFEAIFAAIGELSVEQFVRGFEPSAWYFFEVDQMPDGIIEQAVGRLGRYPSADMLPAGVEWPGYVIGDLNAPDVDSWYYKLVEETKPPGLKQYVQPDGLSPRAENLHNLRVKGYYEKLAAANAHKPRWVNRFIRNRYGPSGDGEPVFDTYSDERHLSGEELRLLPGRGLLLGFDQGLTQPACLIAQRSGLGQLRILGEVLPGRMNARRFAAKVRDEIAEVAPNVPIAGAWADPAGFEGVDKEAGELAWAEIVSQELGLVIMPAPTNEVGVRLTAVEDELGMSIEAGAPALLISPRCRQLRKGFASEYKYEGRPTNKAQDKRPIKNLFANLQDALQYLLLGEKGRYGVVAGKGRGRVGSASWNAGGNTTIKSDFLGADW